MKYDDNGVVDLIPFQPMSYSLDFRKKVLQVQEQEGLSHQQVAKRFAIGTATVTRWRQRLQPKQYTLQQPRKIDLEKLAQDVRDILMIINPKNPSVLESRKLRFVMA